MSYSKSKIRNSLLNLDEKFIDDPNKKTIMAGIDIQQRGTKLTDLMTINVAKDARSFKVILISEKDKQKKEKVVHIEKNKPNIEYVYSSVEGTVLWCNFIDNTRAFYNPETGQEIQESELKKLNPQFLQ